MYEFTEESLGKNFSVRLREALKKNNVTQQKLADELGISRSSIVTYLDEKNRQIPSLYTILKIANFLKVSIEYLFGLDEEGENNFREQSPDRILKKLYRSIKEANLEIKIDAHKSVLIPKNESVSQFLKLVLNTSGTQNEIDELANVFKNYKILNGDIVPEVLYLYHKKHCYIYGDKDDIDDEMREEWDNTILKREAHWKETNGNPFEDLHEQYLKFLEENP